MRAVVLIILASALSTPVFAQRVKQNEIRVTKEIVEGKYQVSGLYGSGWTDAEVQDLAQQECGTANRRLVFFEITSRSKSRGTRFIGLCQ